MANTASRKFLGSALSIGLLLCTPSAAQIATDGTVGPARNLAGPNFQIGADLGATRGANLFHSFRTFNIANGETATFTGPANIANVISRVTGGEVSSIDGLLRSQVGRADFYFINPAGVVFGPNAKIDVPAAFHVGTADSVRLRDGSTFAATNPDSSTLSMASPESFGFLAPRRPILVNGSRLQFSDGSQVSMLAGDVVVQDGASMRVAGGDVHVTAVGDAGTAVDLATGTAESSLAGAIAIRNATVDVSGIRAGQVALRGKSIETANAVVAGDHGGSDAAGGRLLLEAENVRVIDSDIRAGVSGSGRGNDVVVAAKDLEIQTAGARAVSRITTQVGADGTAGDVRVVADRIQLTNRGQLSSEVGFFAGGQGGAVVVSAGSLRINDDAVASGSTGIKTGAGFLSKGTAGPVSVEVAGNLDLIGGVITSETSGAGGAGNVLVRAGSLHMNGKGEPFTRIASDAAVLSTGNAGRVLVETKGTMVLLDGARVSSGTFGAGDGGRVEVRAGGLRIDGNDQTGISTEAHVNSKGHAGDIMVSVHDLLELRTQGKISSSSFAADAGALEVRAGRLSMVGANTNDPSQLTTAISSAAELRSTGVAGTVDVRVGGRLEMKDGAWIHADNASSSTGTAGSVAVRAGELIMDGGNAFAAVTALTASEGDAGSVDITVNGAINLGSAAEISATSLGPGRGGSVRVHAPSLRLDGNGSEALITSEARGSGAGGSVNVTVDGVLELVRGGVVSSGTFAGGNGGSVVVKAGELFMANRGSASITGVTSAANAGSSGNAGAVRIDVERAVNIVDGAQILSSTFAAGNAGAIDVRAGSLRIDSKGVADRFTGITSSAEPNSLGHGGPATVVVHGRTELLGGGAGISGTTAGSGNAGQVTVRADELLIDGNRGGAASAVSSKATAEATGSAGAVDISASRLMLRNGGEITIASAQNLPSPLPATDRAARIVVAADSLLLDGSARITAQSTGNVPASAIDVRANELRMTGGSTISTSSNDADGGPIRVDGRRLWLQDSLFTTSVAGATGNGGNIDVNADVLILETGFIQANTAAARASGGDVTINVGTLIPSGGTLFVGGDTPIAFRPGVVGLNVIQAAAPEGVSGALQVTTPELELAARLSNLPAAIADTSALARDPCRIGAGSSFTPTGRGGLPPSSVDLLRPETPSSLHRGDPEALRRDDRPSRADCRPALSDQPSEGPLPSAWMRKQDSARRGALR